MRQTPGADRKILTKKTKTATATNLTKQTNNNK
jgi:hypothetical protein